MQIFHTIKNFSLFRGLLVTLFLATLLLGPAHNVAATAIGSHDVTFIAVQYDTPTAGKSTWFYKVTSGSGPSISHITFGLSTCLQILDAGTWAGPSNFSSRTSGAGSPVPGSFPGTPQTDPTTGLTGLKFDEGFSGGETRYYYFTVNGNYAQSNMTVAPKAGSGYVLGTVTGPSSTCAPIVCADNLLQNPSFEIASGSNSIGDKIPANWTQSGGGETGVTTGFSPPNGIYVGYVWTQPSGTPATMYQAVTATPGNSYQMTFYSGTHNPSVNPTIAIRFYNGSNVEVGTPAIHTITKDIDGSTLGGPYTLNGTAPATATTLRVIFTDPSSSGSGAGAKGDALCLQSTSPDFGDLPDTATGTGTGNYQTQLSDNGPSHAIVANLRLGVNGPDADNGTLQNGAATADDTSNTGSADDEDGVTTLPSVSTISASVPMTISVFNNTGATANLACWIDFNRDGDFVDTGERAATTVSASASQQTASLTFTGFAAPAAGTSYLRCRVATAAGEVANPTGAANTGEVEDYQVTIAQSSDYGDAPDTGAGTGQGNYNTLGTDSGPSHAIVANLRLGVNGPDADNGTLQNGAATADDTSNTGSADDEDGVTTLPSVSTISASVPMTISVFNNTGATANLACWIDFNRDGDFVDTGERAATTVSASASQQTASLTFTGFAAPAAGTSYLRCRVATAAGEVANPTGAASTGEVEDYQVTIAEASPPTYSISKVLNGVSPVRNGETISFTIRITNTGALTMTTVPLTDTYDVTYLIYVGGTPSSVDSINDGTINWNDLTSTPAGFGVDLGPGQSFVVIASFVGKVDTTNLPAQAPCTVFGNTCNVASVAGAKYDPDGSGPLPEFGPLPPQSAWDDVQIVVPTGVDVADAVATGWVDGVTLRWRTENEANIIGFNVLRSGVDGRLNSQLILAQASGQAGGSTYQFVDSGVVPGASYGYRLQVVRTDSEPTEMPLGQVTARWYLFMSQVAR
jgi:hypothetical protein